MAIGTITRVAGQEAGQSADTPVRFISLSFAGDGTYPAGGTPDFEGSVQSKLKEAVTLLAVIPNGPCGGYVPRYDRGDDKLMMYESNSDASDGPLQESSTANMSGVLIELLCVCM